jgi:hypothetical protein
VVLCVAISPAETAPPVLLAEARYVALGYDDGRRVVRGAEGFADALPEEREALQRIRALIEQSERWEIAEPPLHADLLIAVRTGRRFGVGDGVRIGGPTAGPPGVGGMGSGRSGSLEVSSRDDMLEVFDGRVGGQLWRGTKRNGLSGDPPPLWESFLAEVAKAERYAKRR